MKATRSTTQLANLIVCIILVASVEALAQKVKTVNVSGKAEILMEDAFNIGEIKRRAVDMARIDALEKAFGRVIVQGTNTYIENKDTGERTLTTIKMNSIANSMVRGEMLREQVNKLEWFIREKPGSRGKEQELWLLCEISGEAREVTGTQVNFEAFTMKCDDPLRCKTEVFSNEERMYLAFQSPVNGFLSVFMEDREDEMVYRIFPYSRMSGEFESAVPIRADVEYIFFSERHHRNYFPQLSASTMDPIALGTTKEQLFNRIFVVFSPSPYNKPILKEEGGIKVLTPAAFQQWVLNNQQANRDFQISNIDVVIRK
jgi:hypothetical protein